MNLDLFNNVINKVKESNFVQNFMNELSEFLEKSNNQKSNNEVSNNNDLKQDNCYYQVVDMATDGAYLKNVSNNKVFKETDFSKDVFEKLGNDIVLKFEDGKYVVDDEMTDRFFNSLVGIKEYETIKNSFFNESNILELDPNTEFEIESRDSDHTVLSYENGARDTIKVPNALIPFWANVGEKLYFKDEKFVR